MYNAHLPLSTEARTSFTILLNKGLQETTASLLKVYASMKSIRNS